jgi:hypothetical protein
LPQKLRHVSGDDQWCFNVNPGLEFESEEAWPYVSGFTFCTEEEDELSMRAGALALNMLVVGIKAKGTIDTPELKRQERQAQKYAGYLVGSVGAWRGTSSPGFEG